MSKFNKIIKEQSVTVNYEGAEAFRLSAEMELYTAVVTASLSSKFYETADERIERIADLVGKCNARFVAQLAIYARTKMNLRSVPLLLVVELAKHHSGDNLVSKTIEKVVLRADEIMELLHCYQWRNSQPNAECKTSPKKLGRLSHQIQVGLQKVFNNFDEYQFAKYDRSNLEVKLRDALFIVHPKAKDVDQQQLFDKITNKTLEIPYTWETELSALGQQEFMTETEQQMAFAAKWEELIESDKMGYMAMLRNLRNFLKSGVSIEVLEKVANRLSNEHEVVSSKQFPFRFLSAYREIKNARYTLNVHSNILANSMEETALVTNKAIEDINEVGRHKYTMLFDALEKAVLASSKNITGFDENTRVLLACDVSGSMYSPISPKSSVKNYDIGLVLAMLLKNRCKNVISGIFGDDWKVVDLPSTGVLNNVDELYKRQGEVGFSTNGFKVIQYLNEKNIVVDKIMMFTDCQMWNSQGTKLSIRGEWRKYKKFAPNAKLYLFDLAGYRAAPLDIVQDDVALIAGWSDRIFEILNAIENGSSALKEIEKVEI